MKIDEKKNVDYKLFQGSISVLVATEAYELGVDNPNINQIIRFGCPRNLGVFLQEIGRAGRSPDSIANGLLMFNEHVDDKRLGLWLRSMLGPDQDDHSTQKKMEMLFNYSQGWRFIYAVYHGKCLMQALTTFF